MQLEKSLDDLPNELLFSIFQFFFTVKDKTNVELMTVCKRWNQLLREALDRYHTHIIDSLPLKSVDVYVLNHLNVKKLVLRPGLAMQSTSWQFPTIEEIVMYNTPMQSAIYIIGMENLKVCKLVGSNKFSDSTTFLLGVRVETYWPNYTQSGWVARTELDLNRILDISDEKLASDLIILANEVPEVSVFSWGFPVVVDYFQRISDGSAYKSLKELARAVNSEWSVLQETALFCLRLWHISQVNHVLYFLGEICPSVGNLIIHCLADPPTSAYSADIPTLLKEMAKLGYSMNAQNEFGNIPLHYAVRANNVQMFDLLISLSDPADILIKNKKNQCPCNLTSNWTRFSIAKFLQYHPEEVAIVMIHDVIQQRRVDTIEDLKLLIEKNPKCVQALDASGRSPLHTISDNSSHYQRDGTVLAMLNVLLESEHIDVNARDADGRTPLMQYMTERTVVLFDGLCEDDRVDFKLKDSQGRSVAHYVANASATFKRQITQDTKISIFSYLLTKGIDINEPDSKGVTPYMILLKKAHHAVMRYFIDTLKIDPDALLPNGQSPLIFAIAERVATCSATAKLCSVLIQYGASIDATDADGNNALHLACQQGWGLNTRSLMTANVDQNHRNNNNKLPVQLAFERKDRTGADIVIRSKKLAVRNIVAKEWASIISSFCFSESTLEAIFKRMIKETDLSQNDVDPSSTYPEWLPTSDNADLMPFFYKLFSLGWSAALNTLLRSPLFDSYLEKRFPDMEDFGSRLCHYLENTIVLPDGHNVFHALVGATAKAARKEIVDLIKSLTDNEINLQNMKGALGETPIDKAERIQPALAANFRATYVSKKRKATPKAKTSAKKRRRR